MRKAYDSTFDYDADTLDHAEELALREALTMLGETAGKLRKRDKALRSLQFRTVSSRIH